MAEKRSKKRRGRGVVKTVFNPRQWMNYDNVKESGENVTDMAKDLIKIRKSSRTETFDEAIQRLNLTEQDVEDKKSSLLLTSRIYFAIGVGLFLYTLFNVFAASVYGAIISGIMTFLALVLAYRDSFYYFQMKQKRLGCSFKEWLAFITRRG